MNSKLITPVGGKILAAVGRGGYANWDGPVDFGLVAIYEREIDGPVYNFKFHRSWNDKLKSTIRIGSYQEKNDWFYAAVYSRSVRDILPTEVICEDCGHFCFQKCVRNRFWKGI